MTKDEIINCTDGQALVDAVAVDVMEYSIVTIPEKGYIDMDSATWIDWQPHKPTEKGKAQCWDLIEKFGMTIVTPLVDGSKGSSKNTKTNIVTAFSESGMGVSRRENLQIAVLEAALLTVKE